MAHVYHFTLIARLPWIFESGELRPGRNRIGGYPDPDFVWATTSDKGSRTASVKGGDGVFVRFTLDAADFEDWPSTYSRYPAWTADQVSRLEASAVKQKDDPRNWRCRVEPLPLERVLATHTKTWASPWQELPQPVHLVTADEANVRGIVLGSDVYLSQQFDTKHGSTGFRFVKIPKHEFDRRSGK